MKTVKLGTKITCHRCAHVWRARGNGKTSTADVRICPKCKSPYFDTPRTEKIEPAPKRG